MQLKIEMQRLRQEKNQSDKDCRLLLVMHCARSENTSQPAQLVATVLVLKRISDSLLFDLSTTIWFVSNLQ